MNATATRLAAWTLVLFLAAITGIVSYLHALEVVRSVGNTGAIAILLPFIPDTMIVTSSLTLLRAARFQLNRPWQAVLSLAIGAATTVTMNVTAGLKGGPGGALIAGLVPVAFILTFETLLVLIRQEASMPLTADEADCGHKVPVTRDEAILAAVTVISQRAAAKEFGVSHGYVSKIVQESRKEIAA